MTALHRHLHGMTRRRPLAVLAVSGLLLLGACGSAEQAADQGPPGAATTPGARLATSLTVLIDRQLARQNLSPSVRDILTRAKAAGAISSADYEQAFADYAACVKSAGVHEEYKKLPSGIYQVTPHYNQSSEAATRADFDKSNACGLEHLSAVEALYTLQVGNPDLLADANEVAVRCLVKENVAAADLTAAKFKELADGGFANAPFDTTTPAFVQCLANAGMAVAGPR